MAILWTLSVLNGVLMGGVVLAAWRRWSNLDWGQRWIAGAAAVFFVLFLVAVPMALMHRKTRLLQEIPILVGTLCMLAGFAAWQPKPSFRRAVQACQIVFSVLWIVAQIVQGLSTDFSSVSRPIHAAVITIAAGLTLIAYAQVGADRWTDQPWFWGSIGMMVVYGAEVLLDPVISQIFQKRDDLARFALGLHQLLSVAGWALVLRAMLGPGQPRPRTKVFS